MGFGGAGRMKTQERRTRLAPISHATERRFLESYEESGFGNVSLWNCSICCMAKGKSIYKLRMKYLFYFTSLLLLNLLMLNKLNKLHTMAGMTTRAEINLQQRDSTTCRKA